MENRGSIRPHDQPPSPLMTYTDGIRHNVEFLEGRARDAAQQEVDRAQALDQKSAALIAAALVLLAAGVAFTKGIQDLHAGSGAKTLWVVVVGFGLVMLLVALCVATWAIWPQTYRVVIGLPELEKWPTPRYLDRDATTVRGELMRASLGAVREARPVNKKKADRLVVAFGFFAAAIVAIVVLGGAVAIRLSETSHEHHRDVHVTGRRNPTDARTGRNPVGPGAGRTVVRRARTRSVASRGRRRPGDTKQ
jgi:hypothetical protein